MPPPLCLQVVRLRLNLSLHPVPALVVAVLLAPLSSLLWRGLTSWHLGSSVEGSQEAPSLWAQVRPRGDAQLAALDCCPNSEVARMLLQLLLQRLLWW